MVTRKKEGALTAHEKKEDGAAFLVWNRRDG